MDDSNDIPGDAKIASTDVDLAASPDDVWDALTTEDGLSGWMGPGSSIDIRPDGDIELADVVGGQPRSGRVGRVERGSRLDFVWWPDADPADWSTVSFVLTPAAGGTRLTVTETAPHMTTRIGQMTMSAARANADWSWRAALLTIRCTTRTRVYFSLLR